MNGGSTTRVSVFTDFRFPPLWVIPKGSRYSQLVALLLEARVFHTMKTMKTNIWRALLAAASLQAFTTMTTSTMASAIPNAENTDAGTDAAIPADDSTNTARVTYNGDQVVYLQLPPNGDLVYEELAQLDIDNAMVHADASVRCFFWRQDRADIFKNYGNNYLSWSFSKVLRQPFSHAERLYCYDNTADKTDAGDDGEEGTFTLFVENRRGQKELVRVRVPGGQVSGELDLVADRDVDPELRINVIRAALVDVPREEGVSGSVFEHPPRCFVVSAPGQARPTDLYHVALFHTTQPYLNVLGVVCFRAGYADEDVWNYTWRGSTA